MAQNVSSNHSSYRKREREREKEKNGQHFLENIRNRWQLDNSKKWLVNKYLKGSSFMPCDETGTKTNSMMLYNMPWDRRIEDRSYSVDYSGTLWQSK